MAATEVQSNDFPFHLTHPLYLDVAMMLSFLAHIQGGVAETTDETQQTSGSLARNKAIKARIGFDLGAAVNASLGAEGGASDEDTHSLEIRAQRHHTNASLFNVLYEYLSDEQQLFILTDPRQLSNLRAGQRMELRGEYLGNPFEDFMRLWGLFSTLIDDEPRLPSRTSSTGQRSGQQRKSPPPGDDAGSGLKLQRELIRQAAESPIHDLLMQTEDGLQAVLTVSSQYYSDSTNESLRAGEFRVVGKVTKRIAGEQQINLIRRTVLRVMGSDAARGLLASAEGAGIDLGDTTTVVDAPAVQILPMAIFV